MRLLHSVLFLCVLLLTNACNAWFIRNDSPVRIFAFDSDDRCLGTLEAKSRLTIDFTGIPITVSPCEFPNYCDDSNWLPLQITKFGCYDISDSWPNFYTTPLCCADEKRIKESCPL